MQDAYELLITPDTDLWRVSLRDRNAAVEPVMREFKVRADATAYAHEVAGQLRGFGHEVDIAADDVAPAGAVA